MICSIVIPTIGRDTLARAVYSVLQQGLDPASYEIIVVNDSGAPLPAQDWMAQPQVTVLNTNRSKVCFASNAGAALAKGKYLKILHDDDYLLPGGLRALLDGAEASGCDLVVGGLELTDNDSRLMEIQRASFPTNPFALFAVGESAHMSQSLLKRDAFMAVGGFDPLIDSDEDRDLVCRLAWQGNVFCADAIVARVRVARSPGSAFTTSQVNASRQIRDKAFNLPGALSRLLDSIGRDLFLGGRVARNYFFSAVLNLQAGRFFTALSRLSCGLRVASVHVLMPRFWQGMLYRLKFDAHGVRTR